DAIADSGNEIAKLVATQPDDAKVVDELFMRILSRPAAPAEIEAGVKALHSDGQELAQLRTQLAAREAELAAKQAEWEASQASPTWTELEPTELKASMNATFAKQPDHSVLVEGPNGRGTYTVVLGTELADVTAIRLELLADAKLPGGGPGRAVNGNLALSELRATAAAKSDPAKSTPLKFGRTSA